MVTVAIGALAGWAFSGALIGMGLVTTAFGAIALGASIGSLFASHDTMDFSSSPNYSFGPISNTMSQLVPIYVIYGKNRIAGNIIYQAFNNDKKEVQDLYILIGEGGINAITGVMANDQDPTALDGCSMTVYTNTTQFTHDSRDPSGARPYPDNVALICLTLKAQENLNGTPTITSIVEGMKVWTPNGFAYSRNPIWIILDILCHPRYGMGMGKVDSSGAYTNPDWDKIDYACALAAANYCDGVVEYGPRFQLDFVMDSSRPIRDVLTDFLAVCRGYMVQTNKLEIYIDAPVSTYSRSITPANIVDGSFTFWQAADEDVCNRITVDWVDPDNNYERVTDVFQDSDDIAIRGVVEKSVSLLGVTRSGQVGHMGYYLLKSSMLVRNFCSFGVGIKDCDIQPGEVLTVSFQDFTGWNAKPFRVLSVKDNGDDVMTVTCSEYIPEIYDDSVMEVPVHIDTSLTTNYKPDDVEDLTITEQLETLQDGSYNLIAKITWTPPESYQTLELWYRYSSEVAWVAGGTLPKGSTEYYLPCTGNIGDTLYVRVYSVSRLGVRSSGQTTSRILRGDLTAPAAPTNLQGEGGFRLAHITWTDPQDGDLDHIDVYRSFTADNANDFAKIGASPRFAQEYIDNGLGVLQTAWYKLKAVDVAKNESEFSSVISVTSESLPAQEIPSASIDESKLMPALSQKINTIDDATAAIPAILNALSLDQTMENSATAERTLNTKVDDGLAAEATERLKLTARLEETSAAVQEETVARAEGDNALAQRITTIGAQNEQSIAAIQQKLSADTGNGVSITLNALSQDKALESQAVAERTLTVKYNEEVAERLLLAIKQSDAQAVLEAVNQIVTGPNGLVAQNYIKTDVNGNVAGYGLYNDGNVSEIAILSDRFLIAKADGTATPIFEVDSTTGLVQLIGDLIASGAITGDKINAAAQINLGAGGKLVMGEDAIFQMASGAIVINSETGVLEIRDPNNLTTGNYIRVETGDITTYQYIAGAYRAMKSLRKMETGVGENGETVTLPGYWPSAPKIQVSPYALQSYNASYPNQSQRLKCYVDNIVYNNGVVTFIPRAYLEIAENSGSALLLETQSVRQNKASAEVVGDGFELTTSDAPYISIPDGAINIQFTVKAYAQCARSASGQLIYFCPTKIAVKAYVGNSECDCGSVVIPAFAAGYAGYDIFETEPVSYYKTFTGTLASGSGAAYISVEISDAGGDYVRKQMTWDRHWYYGSWARLESIQWSYASSTQLAEGTLNYVAIAE